MSLTLYLTTFVLIALVCVLFSRRKIGKSQPPQPFKFPIIGHLHLMAGYEVPYQAFTNLSRKIGLVFGLELGSVKCVVINGQKNIREALVTKGHHFDSRPNFERYHQLFSGNKENSLAFCNWSNTQKTRRDMLKAHTFPRAFTNRFYSLEDLIRENAALGFNLLQEKTLTTKQVLSRICANIFTQHFCSKSFDVINDASFVEMVDNYDDIFYEVNQGYAADFLPFLLPFHTKNLKRVNGLTHKIRDFVLAEIIQHRFDDFDVDCEPDDYVESLIKYAKSGASDLSWDSALFALEDIIGGHSAVSNFLVKLFAFLAKEPHVQRNIQKEIDQVLGCKEVTISDRGSLPYTEATIFEAIRLIASPIVPRVANQDSSIDGFEIEKGSVIFLNNYDLSMSEELWDEPAKFKPERFIRDQRLFKPDHFLPFGGGRRSCMGYKMVQLVSFGILGGVLQKFHLVGDCLNYKVPVGSLALPKDTFDFRFVRR